jgi:Ca2+/Na+ antiporter
MINACCLPTSLNHTLTTRVPASRPAVTFVALGNGAPDLSANIAAISAGEVTLSAGALTGAAMFVQVRQYDIVRTCSFVTAHAHMIFSNSFHTRTHVSSFGWTHWCSHDRAGAVAQ